MFNRFFNLEWPRGKDVQARAVLGMLGILAGISYTIGPHSWQTTPIYHSLHLLHMPIQMYGIALIVSSLILFFAKFKYKFIGYIVGGVVYSTFGLSLLFSFRLFSGTVSLSSVALTFAIAAWYWFCAYRASILIGQVE